MSIFGHLYFYQHYPFCFQFEFQKLTDEIEELKKENQALSSELKDTSVSDASNKKEMECMKKMQTMKDEEIKVLKEKLSTMETKHEEAIKVGFKAILINSLCISMIVNDDADIMP